jgi:hypothetical protein
VQLLVTKEKIDDLGKSVSFVVGAAARRAA